ncbi:AAA family ATPase [Gimesia fumaroli]|uniref:Chromosome segregation protein n=1 Tax=Gimesia fumaroli TaxID=2527976 RepID=A0A518IEA3_9PLAN|nr:AAA family ATPase [Gimesia fumaroli]QDV51432.1 chromosome segregation protein [Gimesia fumaroli]
MLKRITLHNFMSHSHTVIDLSSGLTVLTGPNNCGKSAFVSALQNLTENTKGNYMIRHGAKECRVIVETDDGHTIEWKRKKKNASYCIDGVDIHRKTPEQLDEVLRLSKVKAGDSDEFDVHFGEQKSPIFLLGERGSRAARFFASSSDASLLIEMQKLHRGKVKTAQQDFQRQQAEAKQIATTLEILKPIPDLESKLEQLGKTYEALQAEDQQIQKLEHLIQSLDESAQYVVKLEQDVAALGLLPVELNQVPEKPLELLTRRLKEIEQQMLQTQFQVSTLFTLDEPPELADERSLNILIEEIQIQEQNCERASATGECLDDLNEPPLLRETGPLQKLIEKLDAAYERADLDRIESRVLESCTPPPEMADLYQVEQICQQWEAVQAQFNQLQKAYQECEAEYESVRVELVNWAKENPTCPTCGAEMEPEQFIQTAEMGLKGHAHGT